MKNGLMKKIIGLILLSSLLRLALKSEKPGFILKKWVCGLMPG
jgi:hypothetical protein